MLGKSKRSSKSFLEGMEETIKEITKNEIGWIGGIKRVDGNVNGLDIRLVADLYPKGTRSTITAFLQGTDIIIYHKSYPSPEKCLNEFEKTVAKYNLKPTEYED